MRVCEGTKGVYIMDVCRHFRVNLKTCMYRKFKVLQHTPHTRTHTHTHTDSRGVKGELQSPSDTVHLIHTQSHRLLLGQEFVAMPIQVPREKVNNLYGVLKKSMQRIHSHMRIIIMYTHIIQS